MSERPSSKNMMAKESLNRKLPTQGGNAIQRRRNAIIIRHDSAQGTERFNQLSKIGGAIVVINQNQNSILRQTPRAIQPPIPYNF
jgi:hypothetical protein